MQHILPILEGLLSRNGLKDGLVDYEIHARWSEIVGDLSPQTKPLRVQGDVLWVYVSNPTLLQHMSFFAPRIVRKIRELVPETHVRRLKFTSRGDRDR
ncbi:MAG: DUF721 domain-containing protein [Candidatus Eisenbacteria bacterium]